MVRGGRIVTNYTSYEREKRGMVLLNPSPILYSIGNIWYNTYWI
jgi:hypothetical protein